MTPSFTASSARNGSASTPRNESRHRSLVPAQNLRCTLDNGSGDSAVNGTRTTKGVLATPQVCFESTRTSPVIISISLQRAARPTHE